MSLLDEPFEIGDKVYPLLPANLWRKSSPAYGYIIGLSKNPNLIRIQYAHKTEPWRLAKGSKNSFHKSLWTKKPTPEQLDREKTVMQMKPETA